MVSAIYLLPTYVLTFLLIIINNTNTRLFGSSCFKKKLYLVDTPSS